MLCEGEEVAVVGEHEDLLVTDVDDDLAALGDLGRGADVDPMRLAPTGSSLIRCPSFASHTCFSLSYTRPLGVQLGLVGIPRHGDVAR